MMWGMVYGVTALSSTALRLVAWLPVLSLSGRSILMGLLGSVVVWFGRYAFFEKRSAALVGLKFVTVIGLAIVAVPKIPEMLKGMVLSCTKVASSASWRGQQRWGHLGVAGTRVVIFRAGAFASPRCWPREPHRP